MPWTCPSIGLSCRRTCGHEFWHLDRFRDQKLFEATSGTDLRQKRRSELLTFFVLAFGIWPIVAVGVVGGYGFLIWMWQIVFGPPGPPSGMH